MKTECRVWNGETMVSPDYIDRDGVAHWREDSIPASSGDVMWSVPGAKDACSQPVFEGDLLRSDAVYLFRDSDITALPCLVEWLEDRLAWAIRIGSRRMYLSDAGGREFLADARVVGNKHENPELLKRCLAAARKQKGQKRGKA